MCVLIYETITKKYYYCFAGWICITAICTINYILQQLIILWYMYLAWNVKHSTHFLPQKGSVFTFVCWFICQKDYSKITELISTKACEGMDMA